MQAQAAESGRVTLACQGEYSTGGPASMSVIVDYDAMRIFSDIGYAEIKNIFDAKILASGRMTMNSTSAFTTIELDRFTGDMSASRNVTFQDGKTSIEWLSLKCRPAQRMF
jgi:hypothetical protein